MFKSLLLLAFLLFLPFSDAFSQAMPNREFRGVWVATVSNLDWPVKGASPESQKIALRGLLDKIKDANLNVVYFQIRTECDAFYNSSKEPWSRFLTGTQGMHPGYDPLAFAIEEAHKRGLELHAWFNPYRVNFSASPAVAYADSHVSKSKPEWLLSFPNGKKILNPGLPEVREYVASVVQEIAQNYEIDGVHFDDYFYPYPEGTFMGISNEDAVTFTQYGGKFTNIKDWRRDNVNETIKLVNNRLKAVKPEARFGISPFGIWKSGVPAGTRGMDAYNVIYADPLNWIENHYVDYLTPQLYWSIGGAQDYRKLLEWWSDKALQASRHLYAGHIVHQTGFKPEEVPNQIGLTRMNRHSNALGAVIFRAANIHENRLQIYSSLKESTFRLPAAPPAMAWKGGEKPAAPDALKFVRDEVTGDYYVSWLRNPSNTHGFKRYMLYGATRPFTSIADMPEESVQAIPVSESFTVPAASVPSHLSYWAVTELSPNNLESDLSNIVSIGTGDLVAQLEEKAPVGEVLPKVAPEVVHIDIKLRKKSEVKAELMSMDKKSRTQVLKKKYKAGNHTLSISRGGLDAGAYLLILTIDRKSASKKVYLN